MCRVLLLGALDGQAVRLDVYSMFDSISLLASSPEPSRTFRIVRKSWLALQELAETILFLSRRLASPPFRLALRDRGFRRTFAV